MTEDSRAVAEQSVRTPRFLPAAQSQSFRVFRYIAGAIVLVGAAVFLFLPPAWPVVTLGSGRTVTHVIVGHFVVPNESPVIRLRYQTELALDDTVALRAEALELWPRFRIDVERGGYVNAAFLAEGPPTGLCFRHRGFCAYRGFGHLVRKRPDGLWYFDEELMPVQ